MLVFLAAGRATAQQCVTCRTEKCPRKASLTEWCGAGKDPLAKKKRGGGGDGGAKAPSGKRFLVQIESTPTRAVVQLQQAGRPDIACVAPCKLRLARGVYHLVGTLTGWRKEERDLDVTGVATVRLSLEREVKKSLIEVRAAPGGSATGATLAIDGVIVGELPREEQVPPGHHQLTVTRAGWGDWTSEVDLTDGERRTLEVVLPARPTGTIVVSADVEGAEVWVDARRRDAAPAVVTGMAPGQHIVEVRRMGLQPWRGVVEVVVGEQTKVVARLAPQQPTPNEDAQRLQAAQLEAARLESLRLDNERRAADLEQARRAKIDEENRRKDRVVRHILLHPFSFFLEPLQLTAFLPAAGTMPLAFSPLGGTAASFSTALTLRVLWLEGDVALVNWAAEQKALFFRVSIGLSPVTVGTWLGDDRKLGFTFLEPFFLFRAYLGNALTNKSFNSLVIGNRFLLDGGWGGIGIEVSFEAGLNGAKTGFDWAFNLGLVLRVGVR